MRPIAEGPGGLPLRADLVAQQKRLRELEDRVRKSRNVLPWESAPASDNEAEGWLLSYLDLLTLLLVMLVVMLAMSEPRHQDEDTLAVQTVAVAAAPDTPEALAAQSQDGAPATDAVDGPSDAAVAALRPEPRLQRSTAEAAVGHDPAGAWQAVDVHLGVRVPAPVPLPAFADTSSRSIPLAIDMPYTPVPALAALAPPRPLDSSAAIFAEPAPEQPPSPPVDEPPAPSLLPGLDLSSLGEGVDVIVRERSVSFRISNELLFDLGQVDLTSRGVDVLRRVVNVMRDTDLPITVEGHTDPIPIRNDRFPSNWELSTFRATSVLRMLLDAGVDPQRLRAIGYADTRPIADNAGAAGRALNRRVELMLEVPADAANGR